MRCIYVEGIPHWFDGEIALPVMAGAQEPDPYADALAGLAALIGEDTGGAITDQILMTADGRQYVIQQAKVPGRSRGKTYTPYIIRWLDTGQSEPLKSLEGTYVSANGKQYTVGRDGTVRDSVKLSQTQLNSYLGGSGTTGSTRTAAEEALTQAQTADIAVQQQIARERIAEDKRQNLLNNARALVEAKMGERATARGQAINSAGDDPFRFLAQINQQQVGADVQTPYDIFKGQLNQVATQQVPNLSPNATVQDLESAIGKLGASQQPLQSGIGFEGGGIAPLGPYTARLIGEQGSVIAPGTEVLITGGGQATVLPLGPGQAEGGTSALTDKSLTVLPRLFENLRSDTTGGAPWNYSKLGFLEPGQQGREPRLGQGYGALAEPLSLRRGYQDLVGAGVTSQQDADKIVNLIGMLPSPRAASRWLQTLSPVEKEAVVSAYRLAGIRGDEFDAMIQSAVLKGQPRQAVSL